MAPLRSPATDSIFVVFLLLVFAAGASSDAGGRIVSIVIADITDYDITVRWVYKPPSAPRRISTTPRPTETYSPAPFGQESPDLVMSAMTSESRPSVSPTSSPGNDDQNFNISSLAATTTKTTTTTTTTTVKVKKFRPKFVVTCYLNENNSTAKVKVSESHPISLSKNVYIVRDLIPGARYQICIQLTRPWRRRRHNDSRHQSRHGRAWRKRRREADDERRRSSEKCVEGETTIKRQGVLFGAIFGVAFIALVIFGIFQMNQTYIKRQRRKQRDKEKMLRRRSELSKASSRKSSSLDVLDIATSGGAGDASTLIDEPLAPAFASSSSAALPKLTEETIEEED